MKKLLLLLGLLFAVEGNQVFAAKKKIGPKKDDKVTEFFEVISNSFVLKKGQQINGDTFGRAVGEVMAKILRTLPFESTSWPIIQNMTEADDFRKESDGLDGFILNNELLEKIVHGKQTDLNGITKDVLWEVIDGGGKQAQSLIVVLFDLTSLKDVRGEKSRAFLKMFFESEADGNTTIFKGSWNTFFSSLISLSIKSEQERFFFPLFAKLIEKKFVNITIAKLLSKVMKAAYQKYDSYCNESLVPDIDLTPYVKFMKVIISKEQDSIYAVNEMVEWMSGSLFISAHFSDAQKKIKRKEGKELLSLVIKKDLYHAMHSLKALFKRVFFLSDIEGEGDAERFTPANEACKKAYYTLIDKCVAEIKNQSRAEDKKEEYTNALMFFVSEYERSSGDFLDALIKKSPYNKDLADKVFNVIESLHSIGADINHVQKEASGFVHPSLLFSMSKRAHLWGTGFFKKLIALGAKLHEGEKVDFTDED